MSRGARTSSNPAGAVLNALDKGEIAPAYLLYGEDEVAINECRLNIVDRLMHPSMRDGNLSTYTGRGVKPGEVVDQAQLYPFIAERRVLIIEQYAPLGEKRGRGKKKTDDANKDPLASFIKRGGSPYSVLIFTFIEDSEKNRTLGKATDLYKAIKEKGQIIEFPVAPVIFDFLDQVSSRNVEGALRSLYKMLDDGMNPIRIFSMLIRQVRFLFQARQLVDGGYLGKVNVNNYNTLKNVLPQLQNGPLGEILPVGKAQSLLLQHPYVASKVFKQVSIFAAEELQEIFLELQEVERKLQPGPEDPFGHDPRTVLTDLILAFSPRK